MAIIVNENQIPGTVLEAKRWWRSKVREAQKELDDEYMKRASEQIGEKLFSLEEWKQAETVMLYVSAGKEVITREVILDAAEQGKRICLPLCTDTKAHIMEARLWSEDVPLVAGAYGIPEPSPDTLTVPATDIDLVVLPCMSCDSHRDRLGHGAGYYDRFLEKLRNDATTVALCFEKIMAESLPVEEHDQPVDVVLTEENKYI